MEKVKFLKAQEKSSGISYKTPIVELITLENGIITASANIDENKLYQLPLDPFGLEKEWYEN